MSGEMVREAALFCLDLLRCPAITNIIVQDRLLDVLFSFVTTAESPTTTDTAKADGSPSKQQGRKDESMYYGGSARRGFAAEVMDSPRMRNELCPALMGLYVSCHAVAALDANEDVQFDKFTVRGRIGKLLTHLYQHPLPEPRQSIIGYLAGDGFQAFLLSAIDTITFTTYEALRSISFDRRVPVGFVSPQAAEMKNRCIGTFMKSKQTFEMMNLLCEGEEAVRAYLHRRPELLQRVALFVFTFFSRLFTAEVIASFHRGSYADWGLKAASLVAPPVAFVMSCMQVSEAEQESFALLIVHVPDFDLEVFERVARLPEGAALLPFISLSRYRIVLLKLF